MSDFKSTIPDEIWKEIPDFPGYEVSDQGRVRSFLRMVGKGQGAGKGVRSTLDHNPQRILSPITSTGYLRVGLYKSKQRFERDIHSLILIAFVGPCPPGLEACHNDGIPANCFLSNLRWDTKSANSIDSLRHGTHAGLRNKGMANPMVKLTDGQVWEIRELYFHGHLQKNIAKMFSVAQQTISNIIRHRRWRHLKPTTT